MSRHLRTAVILAIGSELTTGSTRDTNSGELAAELTGLGVEVLYATGLPDQLERVRDAFAAAIQDADLVVSTGGLGPTPDDLTREAIAAATGREVHVDPALERWLRALFRRRGLPMPDSNLKQAWLVGGATALRNGNGTAPGWWLDLDDGRLVVALPGPPREMWPMWHAEVRPRLAQRAVGVERATETLRLAGIGESALVELIGEEVLRGRDPEVATYARSDAVDVKITASGPGAPERVAQMAAGLSGQLGPYVFARGTEGWPEVLRRLLGERRLATIEIGSGGQLVALLGDAPFLVRAEVLAAGGPGVDPAQQAARAREIAGTEVGLALNAREQDIDTEVDVAIATAEATHVEHRTAFLSGPEGQRRAALAACTALWRWLSDEPTD